MSAKSKNSIKMQLLNGLLILVGLMLIFSVGHNLYVGKFNQTLLIFLTVIFAWVLFWRGFRKNILKTLLRLYYHTYAVIDSKGR